MPSFPTIDAPLTGHVALVRPAAESDIPEILIAHERDPRLAAALGLDRPPSGAELGQRMERVDLERAGGEALWLSILRPGSSYCRGQIDVGDVDWDHRRATLTVWVAPADRGHGLASDALGLAGRWLLGPGGLERVELIAPPDDPALLAAARRAGFVEEGVLRGYRVARGRRVDAVPMSMIRADLGAPS